MAAPFDPVGSAGSSAFQGRRLVFGALPVEGLELIHVHPLDVSADAPLGEGECHPGLESLDHPGLHLGVLIKVVVQAVGVSVHQGLQPLRAFLVLRLHVVRVDEELHAQVPVHRALALGLRQAPHGVDVVRLHPVEVVLRLGVHQAEDGVGIRFSVDVWNAPIVSDDGDVLGLSLPGGDLFVHGGLRGKRNECRRQDENEPFHKCLRCVTGFPAAMASVLRHDRRLTRGGRVCGLRSCRLP